MEVFINALLSNTSYMYMQWPGINVKYAGFKLSFANISMVNIKLRKYTSPMGAVDT